MSNADAATIATAIRNALNTNFGPMLNTSTVINSVEVVDLSSLTGAVGTNTSAITGTGGAAGTIPVSACAVVSWKTSLHYRGGHPRTYFPLRTASDFTAGKTLTTTYTSALASAAAAYLTAFNAITSGSLIITFVMVSYFTHHSLRSQGTPFAITSSAVHTRLDSQRRRLGKETA